VLVAKYADHMPLARQEKIFARAGLGIARSTLAQWVGQCGVQLQPLVDALRAEVLTSPVLHADETPLQMLKPGAGKTHRAYLWAYAKGRFEPLRAVIYEFRESREGKHASAFLQGLAWPAISSLDPCLIPLTSPTNSFGVDTLLLNASDTSTPFSVTVIGTY
jgi:hypothetical protein